MCRQCFWVPLVMIEVVNVSVYLWWWILQTRLESRVWKHEAGCLKGNSWHLNVYVWVRVYESGPRHCGSIYGAHCVQGNKSWHFYKKKLIFCSFFFTFHHKNTILLSLMIICTYISKHWGPRQNCRYFSDDFFKCIFVNENEWILKFLPKGPINIFHYCFR